MKYTTVDRILSKLDRDLKGNFNVVDIIEWIGDALSFLEVDTVLEHKVEVLRVTNYETAVPSYFKVVLQIVRDNETRDLSTSDLSIPDCSTCSSSFTPYESYKVPVIFSNDYCSKNGFTVVRKAQNNFFTRKRHGDELIDEYAVIGATCQKLRFSFRSGIVVLAYLRNYIDPETNYPYIPDTPHHIEAITYYIKWKMAEWKALNGEKGFLNISQDFERKWLRYVKQANNYAKMPHSIDDYQNLAESSVHLILDRRKYHRYFGNLK